jgi:hypothetical protein
MAKNTDVFLFINVLLSFRVAEDAPKAAVYKLSLLFLVWEIPVF